MLRYSGKKIEIICENDREPLIKEILENSKKYGCKIICPMMLWFQKSRG